MEVPRIFANKQNFYKFYFEDRLILPNSSGNYVFFVKKFYNKIGLKDINIINYFFLETKVSSFGLEIPSNFAA